MARLRLAFAATAAAVVLIAGWAPAAGALAPAGGGFFRQSPQPIGGGVARVVFADATHVWGLDKGAGVNDQLVRSNDGGFTWVPVDPGVPGSYWGLTFPDAGHGRAFVDRYDDAAGVDHVSLLYTDDSGTTWSSRPVAQDRFSPYDAAFATPDKGWMIGTGWDKATNSWTGTLLTTTDAGLTWTRTVLPGNWVDRLTAIDATHLWVQAGNRTLLTSADGGATWTKHVLAVHTYITDVDPVDADHAWIVAQSPLAPDGDVVLSTADGGATWKKVFTRPGLGGSLAAKDSSEAWLCAQSWDNAGGERSWLEHTTNGGRTWTRSCAGPLGPGGLAPGPGGVLVGLGAGVWHSADAGATWRHVVAYAGDYWLNDICATGPTELWAAGETTPDSANSWGAGGGVGLLRHSTDGVHWNDVTLPAGPPLDAVAFSDAQHGWAAGGDEESPAQRPGRVLRTADGGVTWKGRPAADHLLFSDIAAIGSESAVGPADDYDNGDTTIAMTTDGGATWSKAVRPDSEYLSRISVLTPQHLLVAGQKYSRATSSVVLVESTDGGAHWARRPLGVAQRFQDMTFVDATHGWVLASDSDTMPFGDGGGSVVLRTADGGATWQKTDLGHISAAGLTTVRFSDALHGWLFGDMVLKTSDGGATWQDAGVDIPRSTSMRAVPVVRSAACSGGNVWAAGANELLLSTMDTAADTAPPVTCDDSDRWWHNHDLTVHLSPFDAASGIARTEFHIDGIPGWATGTDVTLEAPSDHTGDGRHTVSYRSVDTAGNIESAQRFQVFVDTAMPETGLRAPHDATRGSFATVSYHVDDASPQADVTLKLVRWSHWTVTVLQTRRIGRVTTNTGHTARVRYRVPAGVYYWVIAARDLAGNPADVWIGDSARVTVR